MLLQNLRYLSPDGSIISAPLCVENGRLVSPQSTHENAMGCGGLLALPGFLDIHTHGGDGIDVCDCSPAELQKLTVYYARHGVTAFCPTTMTLPAETLQQIFKTVQQIRGEETGARILGVNLEGPFVSPEKCGAQNPAFLRLPDVDEICRLHAISPVALIDLAPELSGALDFARAVSKDMVCSVAHTNATFAEVQAAFQNGFSHVTHFFNAMTPLHHRAPGAVGAVLFDDRVSAELICDGFHLAPDTVRLAFKLLGGARAVVVSDSLSCAGCPDGRYQLSGQTVRLQNSRATLENGTIAGSTTNVFDEFRNLLSFGIDLPTAAAACSANPAKAIGVYDRFGSIEKGKWADLLFVDAEMRLQHVMIHGELFF